MALGRSHAWLSDYPETNYVAGGRLELVIATLSGEAEFVGGGGYLMIQDERLLRGGKPGTTGKAPKNKATTTP